MAAYETLRAAIDSYIKANGNKEITGTVLNDILNAMVSALGADTRFAGVAVPSTNPGNPEGNVVYFASQAGTYSNFGGIVLPLGIHILVWNGTAWTSQTWFSVNSTPTQNSQNLVTSGGIFQAIVDAVGVERLRAIGAEVTSCSFNSTTKKVSFFNSANSTLFQLDATAFIIDGMVSDVKIEDGNLVIQFNTDAGKQDIEIPLTEIFDPANYYTKTAIDALLTSYYTKTETNALLTAINNKLADGCLYRGMAEPTTNPPTPTTKVFYIATKAGTYTNFGNIAVTEGITILKYDGSNWSKEQISYFDGVFDISAYNGTSYADLSAALGTNGANIPQNLRKGGMSVKFVQSSDNKYVQCRCMAQNFTTDTTQWSIAEEGVYVENPEFVYVKTDREGKILWAIKIDGGIYYGAGCPQQVKDYIEEKISSLSLDEYEDIVSFLSDYLGSDTTLKTLLDSKLDTEGLDPDALTTVQVVENPEWISVITDSEGRVLGGRKPDGTMVENCDVEYPNGIPSGIKSYVNRTIKCLFIGNSISQDHITYLPWLLKNTYPEIDFKLYIAYRGGETIKGYVEDVIPNNKPIAIFSVANNTESWENYNASVSFNEMFDFDTFDIISYEGYFVTGEEDTTCFKQFTDAVMAKQSVPFKFAYLLHQVYGYHDRTEETIWNDVVLGARQALLTTPVDLLLPCGVVTKLVLEDFGTDFLTPDNTHNNEGLPCIMGAYVVMESLIRYLGLKSKVINNPLRITQEIFEALNIPGVNGTLKIGTEAQYAEAQEAAVSAMKWGNSLMVDTCINIIQNQ